MYNWLVRGVGLENFSWEGKGISQIPVVASGCAGDDERGRDVVATSGAVERAVIRKEQSPPPPQSRRNSPNLAWAPTVVFPGQAFTGMPLVRVREGKVVGAEG